MGGGGSRRGAGERERDEEGAVAERGPGAAYHMFVLMEELLDKLKLLSYEEEALRRHNMRPLSRCPSPAPLSSWGRGKAPGRATAASPGRRSVSVCGGPAGAGGSRRVERGSTREGPQPPRRQPEASGHVPWVCAHGCKPRVLAGGNPLWSGTREGRQASR